MTQFVASSRSCFLAVVVSLLASGASAQSLHVDDGRNSVTVQAAPNQGYPPPQGQVYVQGGQGQVYMQAQGQPQMYAQQQPYQQPQQQPYVQQQPQYAQPQPVYAEAPVSEPVRGRNVIGLDAGVIVPVGDWAEITTVAFGGMFRYEFNAIAGLYITGRAGYFFHLNDADLTSGHVPILAGVKYRFLEGMTPFVGGELGVSIWHVSGNVSTGFGSASGSDTDVEFALTLGGGYDFGPVEVRLNLDLPSVEDVISVSSTVGFDFAEF
jgi:opacity protein-like surface antigen